MVKVLDLLYWLQKGVLVLVQSEGELGESKYVLVISYARCQPELVFGTTGSGYIGDQKQEIIWHRKYLRVLDPLPYVYRYLLLRKLHVPFCQMRMIHYR